MLPTFAQFYSGDKRLRHRIFGGKHVLRNPSLKAIANINDSRLGQLDHVIGLSSATVIAPAPLGNAVSNILQLRSKKQVLYVYARRVIALVKNFCGRRDRSDGGGKNNSMRHRSLSLSIFGAAYAHNTVSMTVFPALILNTSGHWISSGVGEYPFISGHKWGQFFHSAFGSSLHTRSLP